MAERKLDPLRDGTLGSLSALIADGSAAVSVAGHWERDRMRVGLAGIHSVENDLLPLGDVTLAPIGLTGVSEAQLARAMTEHVLATASEADPQALASVRAVFADSPLAFRLGALAALMRRR